jgi:hypothetical protein
MAFEIAHSKVYLKSRPSEQSGTVTSQQSLPQHDILATRIHNPDSDTICWIGHLTISSEKQYVVWEAKKIYDIQNCTPLKYW